MKEKFATAINCMDGRVQEPVINALKERYNVDYVDMITTAGPNLVLAEKKNKHLIKILKKNTKISVKKHGSSIVAIIGHYDCAGNLKPKDEQLKDIRWAKKTMEKWNFDVEVIGIWVNEKWEVEYI